MTNRLVVTTARAFPTLKRRAGAITLIMAGAGLFGQTIWVVGAKPAELIGGVSGMLDLLRRATPPDFSSLPEMARPVIETVDIAIFGTVTGVVLALPLAAPELR